MITVTPDDDALSALARTNVIAPGGATYRLDRVLGAGGMSVAFFALQARDSGVTPVVLKITRPSIVREAAAAARIAVEKETHALRQLAARVPPTPFVVKLVDSGVLPVQSGATTLELPWLALEYVHGGAEGTTLDERIAFSVKQTGFAFEPERAAAAVRAIAAGLDAIHEVGVIHRDVTPANILCCGFGDGELFKLADFGIARPQGAATFGGIPLGTPGYAAPEQIVLDDASVGAATDVFSFAAVVFRLLTGEHYFSVASAIDGVVQAQAPARRSLVEAVALCPEIRAKPRTCAAIDALLARATAADSRLRPQSAGALASSLVPLLAGSTSGTLGAARRLKSIASRSSTLVSGWRWTVRHRGEEGLVVRGVAWDGDGSCLAATAHGLAFWNGSVWTSAPIGDLPIPTGVRFLQRTAPGSWLVGGDAATIAQYTANGVDTVVQGSDPTVSFTHASGDIDDLGVLVGSRASEPPILYALAARHWLKPASLTRAASITSVARTDPERWVIAGRSTDGAGFVAAYEPLQWEVKRLKVPACRAYLACAALTEAGMAVVGGTDGWIARIAGDPVEALHVPGDPDVAAVAIDASGCIWAASRGTLWLYDPGASRWACAWQDAAWTVPFVSICADVGLVTAMTPDGGILEGRAD